MLDANKHRKYIVIFWVIFVMGIFLTTIVANQTVKVALQLTSNTEAVVQLYYDNLNMEAYSFDEIHSSKQNIVADKLPQEIIFDVPLKKAKKLRIDFEGVEKSVQVDKISISIYGIEINKFSGSKLLDNFTPNNDMKINFDKNRTLFIMEGNDPFIVNSSVSILGINIAIWIFRIISTFIIAGMITHILIINRVSINIKNYKGVVVIILYIGILTIPTIVNNLFEINSSNQENRVLTQKPKLLLNNMQDYPKAYETYYNDNIPFRENIIKFNGFLKYKLLGISPAKYIIKGQEGWLFYNSKYKEDFSDTVGDYMGNNHYSEQELQQIKENLLQKEKYIASKGAKFYIMIAPNKSQIYSEYMPKGYNNLKGKSRTDLLVEYLKKTTNLNIIYPKEALLESKRQYELYYKSDTHWNKIGAYIGFKELLQEVDKNQQVTKLENMVIKHEDTKGMDLANMMGIGELVIDKDYFIENYKSELIVECTEDRNGILRYNSNSINKQKLLTFRDSFATSMIPYLNKEFQDSIFIWQSFNKDFIEQEKPDIVVLETVERSVDCLKY